MLFFNNYNIFIYKNKQLSKQFKFPVLFTAWYCVKHFPLWRGTKQNLRKYLDSPLLPWAAETKLCRFSKDFFSFYLLNTYRFILLLITWQLFWVDLYEELSLHTQGEGLGIFVSGSREPSLLSSVTQSLTTETFCLRIEDVVHSNELKSPVYKVQHYFFWSISSFFLEWNNTKGIGPHCQLLPFMWALYSLMQVGFTTFSPVFLLFYLLLRQKYHGSLISLDSVLVFPW